MKHENVATASLTVGERPDHLSFGQVSKLSSLYSLSCPRQWAYNKLMQLPARKSKALWYGQALDAGATAYQEARVKGKPLDYCRRIGMTATQTALQQSELPADPPRRFVVDAFLILAEWLAQNSDPVAVQTEHEFTVWGSDGQIIKVIGRSDWIERSGVVVDLKWSGSARWTGEGEDIKWNEDWLHSPRDQVCFYHMARLAETRRAHIEAPIGNGRVVVVCASAQRKQAIVRAHDFTITEADMDRCIGAIIEADDIAGADRHPARPGDACRFCAYVDRCQADSARLAATDLELARV